MSFVKAKVLEDLGASGLLLLLFERPRILFGEDRGPFWPVDLQFVGEECQRRPVAGQVTR